MPDAERMAYHKRIQSFGAAAAGALVERLDDPDLRIASAAGLELAQFQSLDPRHLPALIRAYESGNGWMPRAIAATGTDEAVAYLQARFLQNPDPSSNTQLLFALSGLGERIRPFLVDQLEACRAGAPRALCQGLLAIIANGSGESFPDWAIEPVVALADSAAADETVRLGAQDFAIRRRHPRGLAFLASRLDAIRSPGGNRWQAEAAIRDIGRYGPAAAHLGARLVPLLASADADVRAGAALALGQIESKSGAAELIALRPAFEDDWVLAYNSVEALGRMRAGGSEPLLREVAVGHWHRGVRHNARRALNALAGGAFARPDVPDDGGPIRMGRDSSGNEYLYAGDLRYAGDQPTRCGPGSDIASLILAQDPPDAPAWPERGARRLEFGPLDPAVAAQVRPALGRLRSAARIPFRLPLQSGGFLAGYDQGEWGGGVVRVDADGRVELLSDGNVKGAFRMGGRLHVIHGLSHLILSRGAISIFEGDPPRLVRSLRLPAEPYDILASDRRALLVRTRGGDVALTEDGRLADPSTLGLCTKVTS